MWRQVIRPAATLACSPGLNYTGPQRPYAANLIGSHAVSRILCLSEFTISVAAKVRQMLQGHFSSLAFTDGSRAVASVPKQPWSRKAQLQALSKDRLHLSPQCRA